MAAEDWAVSQRSVSFRALDQLVRQEVERCAARGELHPNPVVATSSMVWAKSRVLSRAVGVPAFVHAVIMAVNFFSPVDLPDGRGFIDLWREQRLAKRLVDAAHRSGWEPAGWALIDRRSGPKISVAELQTRAGMAIELNQTRAERRHRATPFWRR